MKIGQIQTAELIAAKTLPSCPGLLLSCQRWDGMCTVIVWGIVLTHVRLLVYQASDGCEFTQRYVYCVVFFIKGAQHLEWSFCARGKLLVYIYTFSSGCMLLKVIVV